MNLQIENVPRDLYRRLRRHARSHKRTMSHVVIIAIEHELARHEWRERHARRPGVDLGVSAAALLEQERRTGRPKLE